VWCIHKLSITLEFRAKILGDATTPVCYSVGVQPNNDQVKSIVGNEVDDHISGMSLESID